MEPTVICIPANFTDAGRVFGLFEIRNTVEALLFTLPIVFLIFALIPLGLSAKIIISALFVVPIGGFSLSGILILFYCC